MQIIIVGVNHAHQYIGNDFGNSDQFSDFLENICAMEEVDLLAEEMSLEALKLNSAKSTVLELAIHLGVGHLFCDPNEIERTGLGIPTNEEIKASLGFGKFLSDSEMEVFELAVREYWPIREREWLRRIEHRTFDSCLFVVGSDHVSSFSELLLSKKIPYQVIRHRWVEQ